MPDGKGNRITVLVLSIVLALLFLLAGGSKLIAPGTHVKAFEEWGYAPWFVYVVGVIEVVGGLALLAPLAGFSSTIRFYGALLLAADMLGATATHLKAGQMNRYEVPLVLCIACLAVAYLVRNSASKARALRLVFPPRGLDQ